MNPRSQKTLGAYHIGSEYSLPTRSHCAAALTAHLFLRTPRSFPPMFARQHFQCCVDLRSPTRGSSFLATPGLQLGNPFGISVFKRGEMWVMTRWQIMRANILVGSSFLHPELQHRIPAEHEGDSWTGSSLPIQGPVHGAAQATAAGCGTHSLVRPATGCVLPNFPSITRRSSALRS